MSAMVLGLSMVLAMAGIPTAAADGPVITPIEPEGCEEDSDSGVYTSAEVELCWDADADGCWLIWNFDISEIDQTNEQYRWEIEVVEEGEIIYDDGATSSKVNENQGVSHGLAWGESAKGSALIRRTVEDPFVGHDTAYAELEFACE